MLEISAIQAAVSRIGGHVHRTPVVTSESLNRAANAHLFFKCENLQKTGSFKARGAVNAVLSLTDSEVRRGVVTHSSGNHAGALAWAGKQRGVPVHIVMPHTAPRAKREAAQRYGAEVHYCEPTLTARESTAQAVQEMTGAILIHPSNDLRVMAGQGTSGVELLEQAKDLDIILCPVGGGGLLSGVSVAAKALGDRTRVFGVEPAGADDAQQSFISGRILKCDHPRSIADGLLTCLGDNTFATIQRRVDEIITVSETAIVSAMRTIFEVLKLVVEPSGAVAYAALVERRLDVAGKRVGVMLSGGNLDLERLPRNCDAYAEHP